MNMLATIIPKSDQLNSDDLIGQDITIKVTRVTMDTRSEQPVSLHFEGDNGKPYKPGKSMRRVLVQAWGPDASAYADRSLTLYRDPDVKFGGMDVGGIRISHMSHITKHLVMALTTTRGNKKPFVVEVLKVESPAKAAPNKAETGTASLIDRIWACQNSADLQAMSGDPALIEWRAKLAKARPDLDQQITAAFTSRMEEMTADGPANVSDEAPPAAEPAAADDEFGGAFA